MRFVTMLLELLVLVLLFPAQVSLSKTLIRRLYLVLIPEYSIANQIRDWEFQAAIHG